MASVVPILIFSAEEFRFGIDADTIAAIGAEHEVAHDLVQDVMVLFGQSEEKRRERVMVVEAAGRAYGIMVDEIHGVSQQTAQKVAPLTRSLRSVLKPPQWVLGSMWIDDKIVWLLDLQLALTSP